ncbi:DoxX family protein [Roseomonas sp. CCTCC AB2023176]|uniref:DoxX family protein n=1 Tax=Roseomonas sp. CCTCC AB2023176 TaxID=3342640 RepID=UPI0035DB5165
MNDALSTLWAPRAHAVLRIMAGLLFLQHGTQKILAFPAAAPMRIEGLLTLAGWIELVCGALIAVGALTRPAAFLASGMCAVAYWMAHGTSNFFPILNRGELAALYAFVFLYLAVAGAGPWSVDAMLRDRRGVPATA